MGESQHGMFWEVDGEGIMQHRGELDRVERHSWPRTLAELVDVVAAYLVRDQGMTEAAAAQTARELAVVIANHFGGLQFYLPKGHRLEKAIRNNRIWQEFDGRNVKAIARRHRLTEVQIYNIIEEQRELHINRVQEKLFP